MYTDAETLVDPTLPPTTPRRGRLVGEGGLHLAPSGPAVVLVRTRGETASSRYLFQQRDRTRCGVRREIILTDSKHLFGLRFSYEPQLGCDSPRKPQFDEGPILRYSFYTVGPRLVENDKSLCGSRPTQASPQGPGPTVPPFTSPLTPPVSVSVEETP